MSSERQILANQKNASRSTGPRTPGGKLRSRNNAVRHGLAISIMSDPAAAESIAKFASALVERSGGLVDIAQAYQIAENQFDQMRIRTVQEKAIRDLVVSDDPTEFAEKAQSLIKIARYEERAFSRRRQLLRNLRSLEES